MYADGGESGDVKKIEAGTTTSGNVNPSPSSSPAGDNRMADSGFEENAGVTAGPQSASRPRFVYSRDDLVRLKTAPLSMIKPKSLDNPLLRHCLKSQTGATPSTHPERAAQTFEPNGRGGSHGFAAFQPAAPRRRPVDVKDKLRDEQDGIVLSPQRKSFVGGCHATFGSHSQKNATGEGDPRGGSRPRGAPAPRGGGTSDGPMRRPVEKEWNRGGHHDRHDQFDRRAGYNREFERNMGPGLLDQQPQFPNHFGPQNHGYSGGSQRYHHGGHHRHGPHQQGSFEEEPEWFTGGPTSQNDMIELHGFDDEVDDASSTDKKPVAELGSRPPSSVDPVAEPCDGVRHSSPIQQGEVDGSSSDKNRGEIEAASCDSPREKQVFDFDELFKFPDGDAPVESAASSSGASRFSRFFRQSDEAKENEMADTRELPIGAESGKMLTAQDLFREKKSETAGESCDEGGKILNLLQRAQVASPVSPTGEVVDNASKRAHIREMALQGKVKSLADIEGGDTDEKPPGPSDEMSAFHKLLAQVSLGAVKTAAPVDVGNAQRVEDIQGSSGEAVRDRPPPPQIFHNIPIGTHKTRHDFNGPNYALSGLFEAVVDRIEQSDEPVPRLLEAVPRIREQYYAQLGQGHGPKPVMSSCIYPKATVTKLIQNGVNVQLLLTPPCQEILKALLAGRMDVAQITHYINIPPPSREPFANVAKSLSCGIDPVTLVINPSSSGNGDIELFRHGHQPPLPQMHGSRMAVPRGPSPNGHIHSTRDVMTQEAMTQALQNVILKRPQPPQGPVRADMMGSQGPPSPGAVEFAAMQQAMAVRQAQAQAQAQAHGHGPLMHGHGMRGVDGNGHPLMPFPMMQPPHIHPAVMAAQNAAAVGPRGNEVHVHGPPNPGGSHAPPPSLAFMPTSVMRKMTADRDRDNPTPTEQPHHIERPQPMPAMRHVPGGPFMHPMPPSAMVAAANMQFPQAAANLNFRPQERFVMDFENQQRHGFEDGGMSDIARLIGRGNMPNRPLPRVPHDQVMSVADFERMLGAGGNAAPGQRGPDPTGGPKMRQDPHRR